VAGLLTEPHDATKGLFDARETSGRDFGGVRRPARNEEEHAVSELTESVSNLIDELAKLPGIGKKSAERLAYHILRLHRNEAAALADAIRSVKENVSYCRQCYNLAEGELCTICRDPGRQEDLLCVVEQPRDLMALEQTGVYRGLYHVLLGRIAPLEGIGPDQLTIEALVRRVRQGGVKEVVMATNPTVEGDGTALHISNLLAEMPVRITRLARGITTGSVLEFANKEILSDALSGRQEF
jgi:recombination protein RecR